MDTIIQLAGFGDAVLGYLLPFLFVLTVVVFVHELGHFLVARWCGVAVKTFSIGFGPEIARIQRPARHQVAIVLDPARRLREIHRRRQRRKRRPEAARRVVARRAGTELPVKAVSGPRGRGRGRSDRQFHPGDRDLYGNLRPVRRAHHRSQSRYRQSGQRRRARRFPAGRPGGQHRRENHRELR